MSEREAVQCSVCHRALWTEDADEKGRCVDCRVGGGESNPTAPRPARAGQGGSRTGATSASTTDGEKATP